MTIYTVEQRREVPPNEGVHAGKKATYVKLASGYAAWGFASDWDDAERQAVAAAKCLEPQAVKVIRATVNGLLMKAVMRQKGWTKQEAVQHVTDWLTSGAKVSILDYLQPL